MKFRLICMLFLSALCLHASAQEPADSLDNDEEGEIVLPPVNQQQKLGLKLGAGTSMTVGSEPNHPSPAFMLTGGIYYRYRFTQHWSIQPEALISFRGSNYNNNSGEYEALRTYFLDVPLLMMYGLNEKNSSNIVAGLQYSYLLNAMMYAKGSSVAEGSNPAINKHDIMVAAGTHFHTPFIGFQLLLKYGLLNANNGLISTLPPVSSGKSMHHITFEIGLTF